MATSTTVRTAKTTSMSIAALFILAAAPQMLSLVHKASSATTLPASAAPIAATAMTIAVVFGVGVAVVLYLVIPAVFLWFYRSDETRKALEFYDRQPRWTDELPIPVLAMLLVAVFGAAFCLLSLATSVVPLFGLLLSGVPASAILVLLAAAFALAAFLIYHKRLAGWSLGVGLYLLIQASWLVSIMLVGMPAIATASGTPQEQIDSMRDSIAWHPAFMTMTGVVFLLAAVLYALYARKFFNSAVATASTQ